MRVVIVKFGAIGDMVFATPLVREVCAFASYVGVMTLPWSREVLAHHPGVDRLHLFDPWRVRGWQRVRMAREIVRDLRKERYDLALILHRSPLAPLLTLGAGIRQRVGFRQKGSRVLLTETVAFDPEQHEVLRNLSVLEALGRPLSERPRTEMFLPEDVRVQTFWEGEEQHPVIGLFPGGGVNPGMTFAYKRWPVEKFATLAAELQNAGYRVAIFGGRDDEDLCQAVQDALGGTGLWGVGRTLTEFAVLVSRCQVFVGGDTGPLHIAAAVGTPTVALFGPTDPRLVAPLGEKHRVVKVDVPCSPCYLHGKPEDCRFEHRCMRSLEIRQVLAEIENLS
ncbi:lipopolysaccharide heptosyltransferase II [Tumebacillus flagellatus]|uniref:lipopolysaccharide heptosyltransferase II n=1 Tax=Tumebacillus flagellatus TaxID=1157490 RepID=A0A074M4T5_9BACL|nr:lipopolysaccharide heptosyltransferase II [Tumebacillus flagellatus]KEO81017.1 hypothetical protein EL26_23035 [Tumebacillus flagellatus]